MLAFLETIKLPSPMALEMIRRYRAEIAAYEFSHRVVTEEAEEVSA
jgi:hypothetical protein